MAYKPSYKENMSNSGSSKFEEFLDKKTNSYSNYKYGFAIRFPMNWTINKGVSEHTIIKGIEADSLITVSVNVIELNFKKNEEIKSAWDLFDSTRLQYEALLKSKGKTEANTIFENFDMKKIHLFNFEAIQTQMEYKIKQVDFEYINKNITYQLFKSPFIYTITLQVPKIIYEMKPIYFNSLINKFTLVLRKQ